MFTSLRSLDFSEPPFAPLPMLLLPRLRVTLKRFLSKSKEDGGTPSLPKHWEFLSCFSFLGALTAPVATSGFGATLDREQDTEDRDIIHCQLGSTSKSGFIH